MLRWRIERVCVCVCVKNGTQKLEIRWKGETSGGNRRSPNRNRSFESFDPCRFWPCQLSSRFSCQPVFVHVAFFDRTNRSTCAYPRGITLAHFSDDWAGPCRQFVTYFFSQKWNAECTAMHIKFVLAHNQSVGSWIYTKWHEHCQSSVLENIHMAEAKHPVDTFQQRKSGNSFS